MTCEKCGKNAATTHITRIVNGLRTEQHLCGACAQKQGFSALGGLDMAGMWNALFAEPSARALADTVGCPTCGTTLTEIVRSGRAGCPDCYLTFDDRLLPAIQRIHGKAQHAGKLPSAAGETARVQQQLDRLRGELDEKLNAQAYEECAVLRDRIQHLEQQLRPQPLLVEDAGEEE